MVIKNIIFDLGDVILQIDFQKKYQAFARLGVLNFAEIVGKASQIDLITQYETGQITTDKFRYELKVLLNIPHITDQAFDEAWNAVIIKLPKENLDFVQTLRNKYKVFLFSNTNELHVQIIHKICKRDTGYDNFESFFDYPYYSHQLGMRKPNVAAFQAIIKDQNLQANETLFVDDIEKNVLAAKEAGLQILHLTPDKNLLKLFDYV